jgi:threonine synthase
VNNNQYYASHSWNPFFFHGTKTFAYEVCEQLGWESPETVILPVGNGTILLGAYLGFNELLKAEIITKIPRLIGVQATGCAPIHKAFVKQLNEIPKIKPLGTIAEGIAIAEPVRGKQILEAIRETSGEILPVDDSEIADSLKFICKKGFYIEPTAAATIAGINKYLQNAEPNEQIVSSFTGHGLKATEKILRLIAAKD